MVLSPFFVNLYGSTANLQKFSYNSGIVSYLSEGDEEEYRGVILKFMNWCEQNHLLLTISKTKGHGVDFCQST